MLGGVIFTSIDTKCSESNFVETRNAVNRELHQQFDGGSVTSAVAWLTGASRMTFLACFLATQGEMQRAIFALIGIDVLIDALVADAGLVVDQKVAADLLRTPRFFELGLNHIPGFGINPRPVCAGFSAYMKSR